MISRLEKKWNLFNDLNLVSGMLPEVAKVVYWSKTKTGNIVDIFVKHSARWPNKECIIMGDESLTFKQVDEVSNRMAHWLLEQGVKPKDVVAMVLENSPEFIYTWLAINKLGAVAAFINTNLQNQALAHCLRICNCVMVIYHSSLASAVTKVAPDVVNNGVQPRLFSFADGTGPSDVNREILKSYSPQPTPPELKAQVCIDDPAVLIYTSGTTGMPKAAVVSHGRHYLGGSVFATAYHVKNTDRIYCCLPLYHSSAAVIVMGMSFRTGATVILAKKFSASTFWDDCRRHNATAFQYIGELCRYLLNQPPKDNDKKHNVRLAIGNGLRPDIWMAFRERFGIKEIGEFYASTEGNTTLFNWNHGPDGAGAVGHAGPLMRLLMTLRLVKLDIETEEPLRTPDGFCVKAGFDEPGELIGEIIPGDPRRDFKGYHGDKKATEKKVMRNVFKQGDMWFRTGDVLRMDENGYYYFMDRLGDTFRWKGENVSTTEVQEAILTYPGVKEANVYGVPIPGQDGKAGMGSLVVDDSFDIKGLAAYLGKTLPKYAIPIFLRIQESITVTATFKHLKTTLRQEGYNPNVVKEPLFYQPQALNLPVADSNGYAPFGKSEFEKLIAGSTKAKL